MNPKTAIPSKARSSSAIPRPGPARSGGRRGPRSRRKTGWAPGAGAQEGRGRWGKEGAEGGGDGRGGQGLRAPPARTRSRSVLGALAAAGAAVAGLRGQSGRGPRSGSPLHTLAVAGRTRRACVPDANAPPPRRLAPSRTTPHPAPPPQLRALIETGGQRSDSPARPAPPPPTGTAAPVPLRGGARRGSPPTPAARAPAASPSLSGARPREASAGREPAFPAGSSLRPRLTLGVGRRRPGAASTAAPRRPPSAVAARDPVSGPKAACPLTGSSVSGRPAERHGVLGGRPSCLEIQLPKLCLPLLRPALLGEASALLQATFLGAWLSHCLPPSLLFMLCCLGSQPTREQNNLIPHRSVSTMETVCGVREILNSECKESVSIKVP